MRRNLLTERLESGDVLVGAYLSFLSPSLTEFAGLAGFDWIFIDAEHGGAGIGDCYGLVRAADAVALPSVVRVPSNDAVTIATHAETGAHGIVAPHVIALADAERLTGSVHFWPRGHRGVSSTSRAANYGLTQTAATYFADARSRARPIALIEDVEALPNLPEIVGVAGLDTFLIGTGDLAMSMGHPGQVDAPPVREAIAGIVKHVTEAGKVVGMPVGSPEAALAARAAGCRLLLVSLGQLLASSASAFLTACRA